MSTLEIEFAPGRGVVGTLVVEAPEGLLSVEDLHGILFEERVQVVRVEERLQGGRHIQRLAVCEFDGGRLKGRRCLAVAATLRSELSWVFAMRAMVSTAPRLEARVTRAPGARAA